MPDNKKDDVETVLKTDKPDKDTKKSKTNIENKFSKKQIIESSRFKEKKDAIGAILEDDKYYTIQEVERLYNDFMKGEVK